MDGAMELEMLRKIKQELLQHEDFFDHLEYEGWIRYCDALASLTDLYLYVCEVKLK